MASIVPGFEYDIFISYRHNDNRSGWVTQFVRSLQEELAATIKEPISVYFDTNPHDGLLETHNVDKSLENKLKCLILIPIISQTYCDQQSFAWQHEFQSFNKLVGDDKFGRYIKLSNGNVGSRILPVKIHDLDIEDKLLLENELGGTLRSIEFIYKEAGVNRPLNLGDSKSDNQNRTDYRNQVNKVANAIKEIIFALKNDTRRPPSSGTPGNRNLQPLSNDQSSYNRKKISFVLLFLFSAVIVYFLYTRLFISGETVTSADKSIAVIPFADLSPNQDQGHFGIGMMDEILNHLTKIGDLSPVSRTSSTIYKDTSKPAREIAEELGVRYILEGSVNKFGENMRIIVKLIDASTDRSVWAETYERELQDIFKVQTEIAYQVARSLSANLSLEENKKIRTIPTLNTEAYDLYLQAHANVVTEVDVIPLLEKAISLDPNFSRAYSDLALRWMLKGYWAGNEDPKLVGVKFRELVNKAIELDPENEDAYIMRFELKLFFEWDFETAILDLQKAAQLRPSRSDLGHYFQMAYCFEGKFQSALEQSLFYFNRDRNYPGNWVGLGNSYFYAGEHQKALETLEAATKFLNKKYLSNENDVVMELGQMKIFTHDYIGAVEVFTPMLTGGASYPFIYGYLGIAYAHLGRKEDAINFLNILKARIDKTSLGSPAYFSAAICVALHDPDNAFELLEKGYSNHEVEMYWLKVIPIFDPIRNDPRFDVLLTKVGLKK